MRSRGRAHGVPCGSRHLRGLLVVVLADGAEEGDVDGPAVLLCEFLAHLSHERAVSSRPGRVDACARARTSLTGALSASATSPVIGIDWSHIGMDHSSAYSDFSAAGGSTPASTLFCAAATAAASTFSASGVVCAPCSSTPASSIWQPMYEHGAEERW